MVGRRRYRSAVPHRLPHASGTPSHAIERGGRVGAPRPAPAERTTLGWLTLASIALGLAFAVGTPLFQNPDEPSHVDRIRHQAQHPADLPDASLRMRDSVVRMSQSVGLPTRFHSDWPGDVDGPRPSFPSFSAGGGPDGPARPAQQSYQYAHPPAYYLLLAPFSRLVEPLRADLHVLVLRALTVLLAAPLPWLTWWLALEITRDRAVAIGAAGLAGLNGPVVAASSAINNDSLAFLGSALVLAVAATVLRDGRTLARAALLGAAISLAGLTKVTALPVAAAGGLVLLLAPGRDRGRTTAVGLAFSAPGAWWWLRSLMQDGRLTPGGTEVLDASGPATEGAGSFLRYAMEHLGLLMHRALGLYGWAQVLVPDWVAWAALTVTLLLGAGWAVAAGRPSWPSWISLLWLAPALAVVSTMRSSFGNYQRTGAITGLAGRYLYPAAPLVWVALVAAIAAIARRWAPRLERRLAGGTIAAAAVIGLCSLGLCLTGLYGTLGIRTLLARMSWVAPIERAGLAVGALTVAVAFTTVRAIRASALSDPSVGTA